MSLANDKFILIDRLEKARLQRMQAREDRARAFEDEHEKFGELQRPRAPANLQAGDFVRDRVLEKRVGAKKGWRRRSPLEAAFEKGMLKQGAAGISANERFEAGKFYALLWRTAEKGGRDSTDLDKVTGSGANARDLPPGQMRALSAIARIEARLSANDRRIVREVCGLERRPSEVICAIHAGYRDRVAARLCEALDALSEVRG
jgi:hypothetical protein